MALELKNYDPALMQGANVGVSIDLTDITDQNGNEVIEIDGVSSAVNYIRVANAAASAVPTFSAQGDDTNVSIALSGKGTGSVYLGQSTSAGIVMYGDQPLMDSAGNEQIKFVKTTSAVNEITVTNAATGNSPTISATGGDSTVGLTLKAKGGMPVYLDDGTATAAAFTSSFCAVYSPFMKKTTVTTVSTAGDTTIAAGVLEGGLLLRDPNGAGRADTTRTAAQLVADNEGVAVGSSFYFTVRNTADAAETITFTGGSGVTISGTATIAQNNSKLFLAVFTNVTASTEAVTIYSIGTFVH